MLIHKANIVQHPKGQASAQPNFPAATWSLVQQVSTCLLHWQQENEPRSTVQTPCLQIQHRYKDSIEKDEHWQWYTYFRLSYQTGSCCRNPKVNWNPVQCGLPGQWNTLEKGKMLSLSVICSKPALYTPSCGWLQCFFVVDVKVKKKTKSSAYLEKLDFVLVSVVRLSVLHVTEEPRHLSSGCKAASPPELSSLFAWDSLCETSRLHKTSVVTTETAVEAKCWLTLVSLLPGAGERSSILVNTQHQTSPSSMVLI